MAALFFLDCALRRHLLSLCLQLTWLKRCISELSGGVGLCPAGMFCQHNILVFADSLLWQTKVPCRMKSIRLRQDTEIQQTHTTAQRAQALLGLLPTWQSNLRNPALCFLWRLTAKRRCLPPMYIRVPSYSAWLLGCVGHMAPGGSVRAQKEAGAWRCQYFFLLWRRSG